MGNRLTLDPPKKGDWSLPGNYRGIMMLEVAYKILANLLLMRLHPVLESPDHVDHEPQCGFRTGRGTSDASFTVKQLISKRREHGLETWILFLDLAFDRVPRCCDVTIRSEVTDAAEAASDEKSWLTLACTAQIRCATKVGQTAHCNASDRTRQV